MNSCFLYFISLIIGFVIYSFYVFWLRSFNNSQVKENLPNNFLIWEDPTENKFPKTIPVVKIRLSAYTGEPVARGRLELIGGISPFMRFEEDGAFDNQAKSFSYDDFRRLLQCPKEEPELSGRRGMIGFMKYVNVTQQSIESACAYSEAGCHLWRECKSQAELLKASKIEARGFDKDNMRLVRVMNRTLYYDWPWGIKRFKQGTYWSASRLLGAVVEKVKDLPDSVFFFRTWDLGMFPGHFPIPAFSHAPTTHHADLPFPWTPVIEDEVLFHTAFVKGIEYYPDLNPDLDSVWAGRKNKAIFLGQLFGDRMASIVRQVVLDLSVDRPDVVYARFDDAHRISNYNPSSDETEDMHEILKKRKYSHVPDTNSRPGYLRHYAHLHTREKMPIVDYMRDYKYLLVLAGSGSSGRLCTFLAHSGAVILLQETEYLYHFSQRLKPWVHYVPISFMASDLVEKVEWLRAHDDMARQIARNGRMFALSYLRLEDYYCYVAAALMEFAGVADPSALVPFSPKPFVEEGGPRKGRYINA